MNYWEDSFIEIEEDRYNTVNEKLKDFFKYYLLFESTINSIIEKWIYRIAEGNNLSFKSAITLLNAEELQGFKNDISIFVDAGKIENKVFLKETAKILKRKSITKLDALKFLYRQHINELYEFEQKNTDILMKNIFNTVRYKSVDKISNKLKISENLSGIGNDELDKIINTAWTVDGKNFSSRLWIEKEKLANNVEKEIIKNISTGRTPYQSVKEIKGFIKKEVKRKKYVANRLLHTESAYFTSLSQMKVYKELGVKEYQIVATLDNHTSQICRDMDGKHFPISEFKIGVTAPHFHPNCRSTTCPYFDDEFSEDKRIARGDDGSWYYTDDKTYKDWKKVENTGKLSRYFNI